MSFIHYLEYKETEVEWLKQIPKHWDTLKIRRICQIKKRIVGELGFEVLSITQRGIKIKDTDSNDGQLSMDYSKYQLVEIGDFAMNHMDLLTGYVDISKYKGVTSPDYRVFSLKDTNLFCDRYILLLFQNGYLNKVFFPFGQGSSQLGRWRLPTEQFNDFRFPVPPINEQRKITHFLDDQLFKINILISEQEKLIELLKEKRKAVISNAVTKGLNTKVKMKGSGAEWLGDIPEHWEIRKIKWLLKLKNEKTQERSNTIALENIEGWTGRFINTDSEFEGDGVKFNEGDILFGKLRPYLAKVFKATMSGEAIGDFFVLEPNQNLLSEFAEKLLISSEFIDAINSSTYGTKMPRVSWNYFSSMSIPLPPKIEQLQISNYLENAIKVMDELIAKSNHAVALLQERRTALISAAVTGEIDVGNYYGN